MGVKADGIGVFVEDGVNVRSVTEGESVGTISGGEMPVGSMVVGVSTTLGVTADGIGVFVEDGVNVRSVTEGDSVGTMSGGEMLVGSMVGE